MQIEETEEGLGRLGRTRHLSISRRDTFVNDIKNSTGQGIVSLILSIAALALLLIAVYRSYGAEGSGGYEVGILAIGAMVLCIISVVFGILGLKNRTKIRHNVERRGIILSVLVFAALIYIMVRGIHIVSLMYSI